MMQPNPAAEQAQKIQQAAQVAEIANTQADTQNKQAQAGLAEAKIEQTQVQARSNLVNLVTGS